MLSITNFVLAITLLTFTQIMGVCNSLASGATVHQGAGTAAAGAVRRVHFNSADKWSGLKVQQITQISHNTKKFVVSLPSTEHDLGSHVSSFVMIKGPTIDEKPTSKPYTPITQPEQLGSFELIIKRYPEGAVSSYMHNLKEGDEIEVKGPMKKMEYTANMKKSIGMIAGGTGITPMLQVIRRVLGNADDKTEVSLLYASHAVGDVLLKSEIDALAEKHSNFKIHYVLSEQPIDAADMWPGLIVGRVNPECIALTLPKPSNDALVYVCGPPGFMNAVSGDKTPDKQQGEVSGYLKALGFTESMVFKF